MAKKRPQEITIPEEFKTVLPQMESLEEHAGWQTLKTILQQDINRIERLILDSEEPMDKEELTRWRDIRFFEIKLLNLPSEIIKGMKQEATPPSKVMEEITNPY